MLWMIFSSRSYAIHFEVETVDIATVFFPGKIKAGIIEPKRLFGVSGLIGLEGVRPKMKWNRAQRIRRSIRIDDLLEAIEGFVSRVEGDIYFIGNVLLPVGPLAANNTSNKGAKDKEKSLFQSDCFFKCKCLPATGNGDGSLFPLSSRYDAHSMNHDLKIERQRYVLDINKVKLASFNHFHHVFGIAKLYHSPRSKTWFHL